MNEKSNTGRLVMTVLAIGVCIVFGYLLYQSKIFTLSETETVITSRILSLQD